MALAFGAFHRYIYKPLKQGAFKVGSSGRLKALAKAGVAGLFAFHELKQARADALSDGHLRPLADRIDGLGNKFKSLASTLKAGASNSTAILSSAGAVDALSTASQHQGANIKDVTPALGG
ncbi:MAG TPA: hypothetical protein VFF79_17305 [Conexibacter sp.]|nr:hypothetical protein [Conexibacter sp.]